MKKIIAIIAFCVLAIVPSSAKKMKFVDLGLSVKWSARNLGATKPHKLGEYLAWGALEQQTDCSAFSYKFRDKDGQMAKYSKEDGLVRLEKCDDAAAVILGEGCRIPTAQEFEELCTKCKIEWCVKRKVAGAKFTGPNGKSIFIPAAGRRTGTYPPEVGREIGLWSSDRDSLNPDSAIMLLCSKDLSDPAREAFRYVGLQIRAVR